MIAGTNLPGHRYKAGVLRLMACHNQTPYQLKDFLNDGQDFDCATWLHKARAMPKEQFQREVEKELTDGRLSSGN